MHMRRLIFLLLVFVGLLLGTGFHGMALGKQRIDVTYDPAARTLTGTLEIELTAVGSTVYFALFPNLARTVNPHVSTRVLDEAYPAGFDPSAIDTWTVGLVQGEGQTALPFRYLRLPPAFQTFSLDETVLAVDLPEAAGPLRVRIGFTTRIPRTSAGDEGVTEGVLTWRFGWYPVLLGNSNQIAENQGAIDVVGSSSFPLVFSPSIIEATISVPSTYEVISGANQAERLDGAKRTSPADESDPADPALVDEDEAAAVARLTFDGPVSTLGITIAEGYEHYHLDGPIPIHVAYLPGHDEEARLLATYARDVLADYEPRFGPYPRSKLTVVENPNNHGTSFAADGIIWLSARLFTHRDVLLPGILNRVFEFVLAHEIAHQWFGLAAAVDLNRDVWLSEGLAQYAAVSYYENRYGEHEANLFAISGSGILEDLVAREFGFFNLREHQIELPYLLNVMAGFDEAIAKPFDQVEYANADSVRVYDKGYLVARAIAAAIGVEAFDRGLATAIERAQDGRLEIDGLRMILEEISGIALTEIFDAWIFGDVTVDYAVHITSRERTETGHEMRVVVSRDGGIPQPIEVEARLVSGATVRQTWDGVEETTTLIFRTPSRVRRVTIDPDHRIPDRDRLNNNAPVRIVAAFDEAALPLDAYVFAPDTSSGGFSFSRLNRFRITVTPSGATAVIFNGREHAVTASASTEDGRMIGSIAYAYTEYNQPETGSAATTWEPDWRLSVAARRIVADDGPLFAFRLTALDLPSIISQRTAALSIDWTATGAGRLSVSAFDEARIFPGIYLQVATALGFGFGGLPEALYFTFDEIRCDPLRPTVHKLTGRIAVELASGNHEPFNLLNLAMIDEQRTRFFIIGGTGWTRIRDFGTTCPNIEAGIEQQISLSTLGGLLSFSARIGLTAPVLGGGESVLYVQVSL